MRPLKFCQACGGGLEPAEENGPATCSECGRHWYQNMAPTAGAAIVKDGKVLITKRAFDPEKGRYDIPGGFLHLREDPIDALKREVREELNIEIDTSMADVVQMIPHPYGDDGEWVLAIGFRARWVGGEPRPGDDVESFEWVGPDELDSYDFAWEHDRDLARGALDHG